MSKAYVCDRCSTLLAPEETYRLEVAVLSRDRKQRVEQRTAEGDYCRDCAVTKLRSARI